VREGKGECEGEYINSCTCSTYDDESGFKIFDITNSEIIRSSIAV
jgi:hypothetical protein